MAQTRQPVVFVPHGGGPWPFVDLGMPADELAALAGYLRSVAEGPTERPRALLVISAHWEALVPTVMTSTHPPMLYDYYGFPPEAYTVTWPAPGAPDVAARTRALLDAAGFQSGIDAERGFDHGTFVPLSLTYPSAEIPALQLSLVRGLNPVTHLALGRALQPLRDEGVFIIGSGLSFHNLRAFFGGGAAHEAQQFDAWLRDTMQQEPPVREARLTQWAEAPSARVCHPREEHLMPLLVAAGAAGDDACTLAYNGTLGGHRNSAFHFGL